jgi:hypothetical protein
VPGRGLYRNENEASKPASAASSWVAAKSASLSPGKPTMKSEDRLIRGCARRRRRTIERYSSAV